jgi:hypothetical protein
MRKACFVLRDHIPKRVDEFTQYGTRTTLHFVA